MAGISTIAGIVIPISVVRTGDKHALKKLEHDLNSVINVVKKSNSTIDSNKNKMEKWNKSLNTLRWSMVNVTFAMTAMAGIAMPWILATKNAAAYEDQLVKIQSVTAELPGMTSETILGAKAGRPFGKTDVAAGYLEFSKAGFTASESASALNSILDLSVVGFMDVNKAAQLTAQMIRAFNLEASDSSHIMDVMSNVADNSKIDVDGLGIALGYVATVAQSAGQSLEDTTVILGVLADAGLNNSKAGTSLRQVLAALIDPSDKAKKAMKELGISFVDSSGEVKQMSAFLEELKRSLVGLDPGKQQELLGGMFEIRALAGVSAALNRLDDLGGSFDGLKEAAEASGTAMVKAMQQQESSVNQMKSAIEEFKDAFTGTGDVILERTEAVATAMNKLGSILGTITQVVAIEFVGAFQSWGTVAIATIAAIGTAFLVASGPIGWGVTALGLGIASFLGVGGVVSMFNKDLKEQGTSWADIGKEIKNGTASTNAFIATFKKIPGLGPIIEKEFGDVGKAITSNLEELEKLRGEAAAFESVIREAVTAEKMTDSKEEAAFFREEIERLKQEFLAVNKEINNVKEATVGLASQDMRKFIAGIKESYNALITLDSAITLVRQDLDDDIFEDILGVSKFTQTSDKLFPLIENLKTEIDSLRTIGEGPAGGEIISGATLFNLDTAKIMLDNYKESITASETALVELNVARESEELAVKNAKDYYNDEKDILKDLNSEYGELTKKISDLSSARFTNETKTLGVLDKMNNLIKEQELASLGVADANQFIIDSLKLETTDYDVLLGQITKINNEMTSNTGAFDAWQTAIKEAILAEVEAGQTLGEDVSARVKTWQTALLGISGTDAGAGSDAQLTDYVNKLQMSYDVHFGGMQDDVSNFLSEQKDSELGVFNTSSQLIDAINEEIIKRDSLAKEIETQEGIVSSALTDLNTKTLQLNTTIGIITANEENIRNTVKAIMELSEGPILFANGLATALEIINKKVNDFYLPGIKPQDYVDASLGEVIGLKSLIAGVMSDAPTLADYKEPEPAKPLVPNYVPLAPIINRGAEIFDKVTEPIKNYFEIQEMIVQAENPQQMSDASQEYVNNNITITGG